MFFEHLEKYEAFDTKEHKNLEKVKGFIRTKEAVLFSRENLEGHITASAWVLNKTLDKALVVHHKKLNKWLQPGGHADGCQDVLHMARQEVFEETGIKKVDVPLDGIFDIDVHPIPAFIKDGKEEPPHFHYDIRYLLVADEEEPLIVSDESNAVSWMELDEVTKHTPELARLVQKTIKFKKEYLNGRA